MDNTAQQFHSGFVAVVGRPNVGKSTLVNRLVGEKVSIVSPKPQTTRNRILGIVGTEHSQVVFVDTPGIHKPKTKLGEYMEKSVQDAVQGIDILCVLIDASKPRPEDHELAEGYKGFKVPKYIIFAEIPKTSTGKVQKFELRQAAKSLAHEMPKVTPSAK